MLKFLPEILLWGSLTYFWLLTTLLIIVFFISDSNENGYGAFISFLIYTFLVVMYSTLDLSFLSNWVLILGYFILGFIYSLVRAYIFGRASKERFNKDIIIYNWKPEVIDDKRVEHVERIIFDLKEHVFRWWFLWPISLLRWVFTDLLLDVFDIAYAKFSNLFKKIVTIGFNSK